MDEILVERHQVDLEDLFAAMIAPALIGKGMSEELVAKRSYSLARALIKERDNGSKTKEVA